MLITLFFLSEGYPGGSQSSVAGDSQLPFPAASQTHLRSGTEGSWKLFVFQQLSHGINFIKDLSVGFQVKPLFFITKICLL